MKTRLGPQPLRTLVLVVSLAATGALAGCDKHDTVGKKGGDDVSSEAVERQARLVEACINGTHAHQILLRGKKKKGDAQAFNAQGLTEGRLAALVRAHQALAAADARHVADWVDSRSEKFKAADALEQLLAAPFKFDEHLPVCVAEETFTAKAPTLPPVKARALASLLQVVLEVDRDGGILQDMCRLYAAAGLLVGPAEFGVEDSNRAFLAVGTELAGKCCRAPYSTRRAAWQVALRKIQNWSLKHRGIGPGEYADEVLARDDVKPLIGKIKAMKPQRILVIGHSYTMKIHWSTLAPMNEIVRAVFEKLNPRVVVTHMGHGGMRATQARDKFLKDALAYKPDRVLVVVVMQGDDNLDAMDEMTRAFRNIGAEVSCFDQVYVGRETWINPDRAKLLVRAKDCGLTVIEVGRLLEAHPEKPDFVALDGVHMRPSYHKFMAGEWLKFLTGARRAKLPVR